MRCAGCDGTSATRPYVGDEGEVGEVGELSPDVALLTVRPLVEG